MAKSFTTPAEAWADFDLHMKYQGNCPHHEYVERHRMFMAGFVAGITVSNNQMLKASSSEEFFEQLRALILDAHTEAANELGGAAPAPQGGLQ